MNNIEKFITNHKGKKYHKETYINMMNDISFIINIILE